jgi:hypothetical protein
MITQKFKGDPIELQMEAVAKPAFVLCSASLSDFAATGYLASPFLLMLYDSGRMPFSDRVPRDAFVTFFKEALGRFPFTGTFESYLFILKAVFGEGSGILFAVPAPGQISITVSAEKTFTFDFIATEFDGTDFVDTALIDQDGKTLAFSGALGIDSAYKLSQFLSELIPAGIFPSLALTFFTLSEFIDSGGNVVGDSAQNQIVFIETS